MAGRRRGTPVWNIGVLRGFVGSFASFRSFGTLKSLGFAAALAAALCTAAASAREPTTLERPLETVALAELPTEARVTARSIHAGGPFPYAKDGSVFGNRERLLPVRARGYYREYTVPTPGARDRGARRIVCGGVRPVAPETCYYTADHYASFKRIAQ